MRRKPALSALLLLLTPVGASLAEPGWISDPKSGCRLWMPDTARATAARWTGECRNGWASGRGAYELLVDGTSILKGEAEFRAGKREGRGSMVYPGGDRYDGDFKDGDLNGFGLYAWSNGARYDGEWADGLPHGEGAYTVGTIAARGTWRNGCFDRERHQVALFVSRGDCGFE